MRRSEYLQRATIALGSGALDRLAVGQGPMISTPEVMGQRAAVLSFKIAEAFAAELERCGVPFDPEAPEGDDLLATTQPQEGRS